MNDKSTFPVLFIFAIGIMIVLVTGPSPGSSDTGGYSQSYSSSEWSSQQATSSSSWDGETIMVVTILVIGIPLLLSFRGVRQALFGVAGGAFGHPRALIWFIIGFVGMGLILLTVNPDPTSYDIPPIVWCAGGGMLLAVAKGF